MTASGDLRGIARGQLRGLLRRFGIGNGFGAVLRARMRHGVGPAGAAALAVGMLVWPDAGPDDVGAGLSAWAGYAEALGMGTITLGLPVTAAVAVWHGGADGRAGTGWLQATTARAPFRRVLGSMAAVLLWPLCGYAVASGVRSARVFTALEPPEGSFPFDALASNAASLVAVACVGYAVGRIAPLRVAAPAAGIGVFAFFSSGLSDSLGLSDGSVRVTYADSEVPNLARLFGATPPAWLPWAVTGVFLGAAVATVLACARRWVLAVLVLVPVLAVQLWLAASPKLDGDARTVPPPVEFTCGGIGNEVCVAENAEDVSHTGREALGRIARVLHDVRGTPAPYVVVGSSPLEGRNGVRGDGWAYLRSGPSSSIRQRHGRWPLVFRTTYFDAMDITPAVAARGVMAAPGRQACHPEASDLYTWLLPPYLRATPYADDGAWYPRPVTEHPRLAALSPHERTTWLNRYFGKGFCAGLPQSQHRGGAR